MVKVLRVSHSACIPAHRERDRALAAAGVDLTLALPMRWAEDGAAGGVNVADDGIDLRWMEVRRSGDVNRHRYTDEQAVAALVRHVRPDLLDLHEEPVSIVVHQWMAVARRYRIPVVLYTAQNIDKRFPPPFAQYERRALAAATGIYPCSRQAASVVRGKGFRGLIEVLPLGHDPRVFAAGEQSLADAEIKLGLFGRLVPEKGVVDAVQVLAAVQAVRPARLLIVGTGPELEPARRAADALGVSDRLDVVPWLASEAVAERYRQLHVVLVPSRATSRWVEQFGRVIVEGQASGAVVAGYVSGAIPEVAGNAGLLVPESDAGTLALAVVTLVTNDQEFGWRRAEGLARARRFTWAAVAERHVAFYEKALVGARSVGSEERSRPDLDARTRARLEFGAPACVLGQERPFALPVLRDRPSLGRLLGGAVDAVLR